MALREGRKTMWSPHFHSKGTMSNISENIATCAPSLQNLIIIIRFPTHVLYMPSPHICVQTMKYILWRCGNVKFLPRVVVVVNIYSSCWQRSHWNVCNVESPRVNDALALSYMLRARDVILINDYAASVFGLWYVRVVCTRCAACCRAYTLGPRHEVVNARISGWVICVICLFL